MIAKIQIVMIDNREERLLYESNTEYIAKADLIHRAYALLRAFADFHFGNRPCNYAWRKDQSIYGGYYVETNELARVLKIK